MDEEEKKIENFQGSLIPIETGMCTVCPKDPLNMIRPKEAVCEVAVARKVKPTVCVF